jgi:hypothetical protein
MRAAKVILLFVLLSIIMWSRPIFAASSSLVDQGVGHGTIDEGVIYNAPNNWVDFNTHAPFQAGEKKQDSK